MTSPNVVMTSIRGYVRQFFLWKRLRSITFPESYICEVGVMSFEKMSENRKVLFVVHYGNRVKRWEKDVVTSFSVNNQALRYTVKDDVTYAMMSLSGDIQDVHIKCSYVSNWGLDKFLGHSVHLAADSVVSIDLMSRKVTVTEHDLSGADVAVLCQTKSPLTYSELRRTKVTVSGCCPNLGHFDPKSAPEAVKLANSSFVYAVPECKCDDKCQYHHMYKFISNSTHDDSEAFPASADGMMWEGPAFQNRELPKVANSQADLFPVLIGTLGCTDNTLLEIPVTKVEARYTAPSEDRSLAKVYGRLRREWGYKAPVTCCQGNTAPLPCSWCIKINQQKRLVAVA